MDVRELFLSCVGSADGDFGIPQLRQVLSSVGSEELPEEKLAEMMIQLDLDGDGRVSLEDFTIAMSAFVNALSGGLNEEEEDEDEVSNQRARAQLTPEDSDYLSTSHISEKNFSVEKTRLATKLDTFASQCHLNPDDLAMLWEYIDEYVESAGEAQREEVQAANKRCSQMAQINQSLNEEMQRIESEYNDSVLERKRSMETLNDNAKLQANIKFLQADIAKLSESEKSLQSRVRLLEGENEKLNKKSESHDKEVDKIMDKYRTLEREKDIMVGDYRATVLERDNLLVDLKRLAQTIKEFEAENAILKRNADDAENENNSLRSMVDELRLSLTVKEDALESLRASLDEQTALVQNLQSDGSGTNHHGSVLNEIEDIVMSQLREENAETEENKKMTVALLSRLLPRIEETKLTHDPVAGTSATSKAFKRNVSAPTLPVFQGAARIASPSELSAVSEESSTPSRSPQRSPERRSSSPRKGESALFGTPPSGSIAPLARSGSGAAAQEGGVLSAVPSARVRRSSSSSSGVSMADSTVPPAHRTPEVSSTEGSKDFARGLKQAKTLEHEHEHEQEGEGEGGESSDEQAAPQQTAEQLRQAASDAAGEEKLNQVLRLYAASTQHLVGMKIVTRDQAEGMDIHALRQLKRTLEDLKTARSQRLVEALRERDNLRNEILVKRTAVIPILDMWRLNETDSTRSTSPSLTPRGGAQNSLPTPTGVKRSSSFKGFTSSGSVKKPDPISNLKKSSLSAPSAPSTPLRHSSVSSTAPASPRTSAFDFGSWFRSSPKTSQSSSRPTTPPGTPSRSKGEGTELFV